MRKFLERVVGGQPLTRSKNEAGGGGGGGKWENAKDELRMRN